MGLINCATCDGFNVVSHLGSGFGSADCCDGNMATIGPQSSCQNCTSYAGMLCHNHGGLESGGCDSGLSIAPKKPRLTSGISRMRSASGTITKQELCACGCYGLLTIFSDGTASKDCSCCDKGKSRLTASPMRSVTGEAGAVSNDTIRKYAQFALVISLVALSVNIYSMRKNK